MENYKFNGKDGFVRQVELRIYQKQRNKENNLKIPLQLILPFTRIKSVLYGFRFLSYVKYYLFIRE